MVWNRSNAIGLARVSCTKCGGIGIRRSRGGTDAPCNCVFRGIFRACWNRFRECAALGTYGSAVSLEFCNGLEGRRTYSRKREEYMADFCLVTRRFLNDAEHRIFRFHFLLGADWKMCCQRLNMDRGTFFHEVYRMEQKLGRVFAELRPYALFPVDEYFHGQHVGIPVQPCTPAPEPRARPLHRLVA